MKKTILKSVAIISVAIISGCASQQIANTKDMDNVALQQAKSSTKTPQEVCEAASISISKANKEKLHFYAPLHLERAAETLLDGQKEIKSPETQMEGVKKCYKVNGLVDEGIKTKAKVVESLSDVLAELAMLNKIDSEKKYTDDIQDFKDDIIDLIKDIESGKMNEAMQGQASLNKEMLELEVDIIIDKNLTPVAAMLEKAEDADADDLAEKTFEKAEKELESAKKFVRANFRNHEQVMATSALAMRSAKHAYYVALEVEKLMGLKEEAAEERILYFESLIERINKKFDDEVVIGNSLYEQAGIVSERVEALQDDYKKKSQLALSAQLLSTELKNAKPLNIEKTDDKSLDINASDQPVLEIGEPDQDGHVEDVLVPAALEAEANIQKKGEADSIIQSEAVNDVDKAADEAEAVLKKPDSIESIDDEMKVNETESVEAVDAPQDSAAVVETSAEASVVSTQEENVSDVAADAGTVNTEVEVTESAGSDVSSEAELMESPAETVKVQATQE